MALPTNILPIGTIETPFKQKFAIPRQPNLADARGIITFGDEFADPRAFEDIENYSHLWLLFYFHETAERGWKPAVKAPRLGGNATTGVFASRSTHRPNSIGMSVVKNNGVTVKNGKAILRVSGVDLVSGTPILDIKPYIAYADAISSATDSITAVAPIPALTVTLSSQAQQCCQQLHNDFPDLESLIRAVLAQDPRPAYKQKLQCDPKTYKVMLYNFDISWRVTNDGVVVEAIDGTA
ncbi:tRNA (N6-threonylcarbamoyladenosine(37)-N6)-methyltransferase TrmO [Alteromonas confluentis]|uniref:tRNA (N6-threonylcarbamoyladenosine(37)-N6)-methyltransferase TrmO n=1 Tax=Alteromonas confluentis TaxID=1656094 RepID=A0A1E7Z7X2_9ALTE|nr:tRNA (N6-threonylcarbamoyladenosine(37)-N6)-methyltransferase TrmO [Alteromonas confluentis]OFC69494.1 tRNA (N6-threonylcarbamoyladenosine(37)-N6)-methyltransferase TrmO [Alteromonas confluentis]